MFLIDLFLIAVVNGITLDLFLNYEIAQIWFHHFLPSDSGTFRNVIMPNQTDKCDCSTFTKGRAMIHSMIYLVKMYFFL